MNIYRCSIGEWWDGVRRELARCRVKEGDNYGLCSTLSSGYLWSLLVLTELVQFNLYVSVRVRPTRMPCSAGACQRRAVDLPPGDTSGATKRRLPTTRSTFLLCLTDCSPCIPPLPPSIHPSPIVDPPLVHVVALSVVHARRRFPCHRLLLLARNSYIMFSGIPYGSIYCAVCLHC